MLSVERIYIDMSPGTPAIEHAPVFSVACRSITNAGAPKKCRLQVFCTAPRRQETAVWDAELHGADFTFIRMPDSVPLRPHARYGVRAMVWDAQGPSEWSKPYFFDTAFLAPAVWEACFISADDPAERTGETPCFLFSRVFRADAAVAARLYITAKGAYLPRINGERVSSDVLTPGYMSYADHLAYQCYDVLPLIRRGQNLLEVLVGDGWYKGYLSSVWHRNYYGDRRELLCQLHLTYADGRTEVIGSGEGFTWRRSNILMSEIYCGEICDAAAAEGAPRPVLVRERPPQGYLHTSLTAPMRAGEAIMPVRMLRTPKGETVLDFGRVITGTIELTVSGARGGRVVLRCGDTLDPDGNFYNDNVELFSLKGQTRPTLQRLEYRLSGNGQERYRPSFTYQCFRYVHIAEFPGEAQLPMFRAIPITSFTGQTGFFTCGDQQVNGLFENIIRTQQCTYMDIPIAGPQRAERLGWTGDNQLITPMSCRTMFGTLRFFSKWLEDVRFDQTPDGQVGTMAPYVSFSQAADGSIENPTASAAWGDAAVIVPWELYAFYGDKAILARYVDMARRYVEFMRCSGEDELTFTQGFSFGDWFALDDGEDAYPGKTDKTLIACFYYYRSASLLVRMFRALGREEEAVRYETLAGRIRYRLQQTYFSADGRLTKPTQTACAMAIMFGIAEYPKAAAGQLAELIHRAERLETGFIGSSMVLPALCRHGYAKLAYDLFLKKDYPSWLYSVACGATSIWEHWNSVKPDGTLWSPNMNSFCHLTFASVAEWMFAYILGVRQAEGRAGYREFTIAPVADRRLGFAEGSFQTSRGRVCVSWRYEAAQLSVTVQLPPGTSAQLFLPDVENPDEYVSALHTQGYLDVRAVGGSAALSLAGGQYIFRYPANPK